MRTAPRRALASAAALVGAVAWAGAAACAAPAAPHPAAAAPQAHLDVAALAARTSAFQRAILADGAVTFAEYETAVGEVVECLTAAGMDVGPPEPRDGDHRFLTFSFQLQIASPELGAAGAGQVPALMRDGYESCAARYLSDVERVWFWQHQLPPDERERQRVLVLECLHRAGVDIAPDEPHHEVHHEVEHHLDEPGVGACRQRYPDYFVPEFEPEHEPESRSGVD